VPITKSALKALRKDKRKTRVNKLVRSRFRTACKKMQPHPTEEGLKSAFSCLDRAVKKKLIHKNKAARLKSKLARLLK